MYTKIVQHWEIFCTNRRVHWMDWIGFDMAINFW